MKVSDRINLPTSTGKTKVNLNIYRNLHYRSKNGQKVKYGKLIEDKLVRLGVVDGKFKLKYYVTACNNRKFDIMNVVSIVDKFFCDCLQDVGVVEEDNFEHLVGENVEFCGIDESLDETKVEVEIISGLNSADIMCGLYPNIDRGVIEYLLIANGTEKTRLICEYVSGFDDVD